MSFGGMRTCNVPNPQSRMVEVGLSAMKLQLSKTICFIADACSTNVCVNLDCHNPSLNIRFDALMVRAAAKNGCCRGSRQGWFVRRLYDLVGWRRRNSRRCAYNKGSDTPNISRRLDSTWWLLGRVERKRRRERRKYRRMMG